jgi:hypothetical protein
MLVAFQQLVLRRTRTVVLLLVHRVAVLAVTKSALSLLGNLCG